MTEVSRRALVVAAGVTVALTAASMGMVALGQGHSGSVRVSAEGGHGPDAATWCRVPASLPGRVVTVTLADMGPGMMGGGWSGGPAMRGGWMRTRAAPRAVPSGQVTLVAYNLGMRTHELVVLPLATGAAVGARTVGPDNKGDETGSLGEASRACGAGSGDGITTGAAGWVSLTLEPGRYEPLCNLPGHYAAGMYTEFDVT